MFSERLHLLCSAASQSTAAPRAGVFQAHMASKRHRKAAERAGCGDDQEEQLECVVWAEAARPRGADGETHAERLVRMHQVRGPEVVLV